MIAAAWADGLSWPAMLVIAGIALIVLEIITPMFLYLGFAVGAFATAAAIALIGLGFTGAVITFGLISFLSFVVLRWIFRKRGDTRSTDKDVNQY